jgi:hypothetical protein
MALEASLDYSLLDTFIMAGDVTVRLSQSAWNCGKMGSAEEWLQAIEDAYVAYTYNLQRP